MTKEDNKWLLQWVIDPETSQREGFNRTLAYTADETINDTKWYTLEQLGAINAQ